MQRGSASVWDTGLNRVGHKVGTAWECNIVEHWEGVMVIAEPLDVD